MSRPKTTVGYRERSAARLAAVQALYQMEMSGVTADVALRDLARHEPDPDMDVSLGTEPDRPFLGDLVRGASERREDVDNLLKGALAEGWPLERLEAVLRAILRAGTWELLSRPDIDAPVVITEYVRIAEAFFEGGEPRLVNGVLDRLASVLRVEDSGAPAS